MKAILAKIFAKIASSAAGPFRWLAALLIDKLIALGVEGVKRLIGVIRQKIEQKKRERQNAQTAAQYKETLKDGAVDADQISSTEDVLNSNRD